MIRLLPGVNPSGVRPEILLALPIAEAVWRTWGAEVLWITSLTDGVHKDHSLHYSGLAMDLRVRNLPPSSWERARDALHAALGPYYDVLLEPVPPHIHVEFDPPKPA